MNSPKTLLRPLLIFTFFTLPSLSEPTQHIASCLTHHKVNNFTICPYPNINDSSTPYYMLLNFSIQNLRYAKPTLPKPIAIILPETKDQLEHSVLCCRNASSEILVRSGGHSYEGTSSVAATGGPFAIIDLMNLNRVSVDLESETALVEGGATLGEVYHSIADASPVHGFSAGSCPTVGTGGHIAGGGFGLLSRRHGVAADNVVDALLIDADGRSLNRAAMGDDVFWAIRGGGGGVWGVVYAWKIKLLKVPRTVSAFNVSRPGTKNYVAELVHTWQFVAPKLVNDFYLSLFVGAGLPETKTVGMSATFKGLYLGPRSEALFFMKRDFPELGITEEDCFEMSWIQSVVYFSGLPGGSSVSELKNRNFASKGYFKAKSDYVRDPISEKGIMAVIEKLDKEPKGYVIFDPYGGIMENISIGEIAFPHREGNLYAIQYIVDWKEEDNDKSSEYVDWIRGFYDLMTPFVSSSPRAAYVNYMDFDLGVMELTNSAGPSEDPVEKARVWGEKYFLKNYERLVTAKTRIDPNNVFNHLQGIPPKPPSEFLEKGYECE